MSVIGRSPLRPGYLRPLPASTPATGSTPSGPSRTNVRSPWAFLSRAMSSIELARARARRQGIRKAEPGHDLAVQLDALRVDAAESASELGCEDEPDGDSLTVPQVQRRRPPNAAASSACASVWP